VSSHTPAPHLTPFVVSVDGFLRPQVESVSQRLGMVLATFLTAESAGDDLSKKIGQIRRVMGLSGGTRPFMLMSETGFECGASRLEDIYGTNN
jgi:hypothetical protein